MIRWAGRDSPVFRQHHGDAARWGEDTHLLALILDALRDRQFQAGRLAGAKGGTRPKPIPRPGVETVDDTSSETVTGDAIPTEQWADYWKTGVAS